MKDTAYICGSEYFCVRSPLCDSHSSGPAVHITVSPSGLFREQGTIVCHHSNQRRRRRLQSCSHFFVVTVDVQRLHQELFLFFKIWNHKGMGRNGRARRLSFTFPSFCWKPPFCCESPTWSCPPSPPLNVKYTDCLKRRMCLTVMTEHISATLKNLPLLRNVTMWRSRVKPCYSYRHQSVLSVPFYVTHPLP